MDDLLKTFRDSLATNWDDENKTRYNSLFKNHGRYIAQEQRRRELLSNQRR